MTTTLAKMPRMPLLLVVWLLVSRLGFCLLTLPHRQFLVTVDSERYLLLAKNLWEGRGFTASSAPPFVPEISRVPGYPLFLAALGGPMHWSTEFVAIFQSLLSVLMFAMAWFWLERLTSRTAATLAVGLWSLDLGTVFHTPQILTESLFLAILVAALSRTHRALVSGDGFALAGFWWSVATVIKPVTLFLPLLLLAGIKTYRRRAIIFFACAYALPLAWVGRNVITAHFSGYTVQGGVDLLRYPASGVEAMASHQSWSGFEKVMRERVDRQHSVGYGSEAARSDAYGRYAVRVLIAHPFLSMAWLALGTIRILFGHGVEMIPLAFWGGGTALLQQATTGISGSGTLSLLKAYPSLWAPFVLYEIYLLFMYGAFLIGCLHLKRQGRRVEMWFLTGGVLYFLMISNHQGYYRYRLPLLPLIAAGAAIAFDPKPSRSTES